MTVFDGLDELAIPSGVSRTGLGENGSAALAGLHAQTFLDDPLFIRNLLGENGGRVVFMWFFFGVLFGLGLFNDFNVDVLCIVSS